MYNKPMMYNKPWILVYEEGEGEGTGTGTGTGEGEGTGNGTGNGESKLFTQEQVNKFLAEDKRKSQESTKKLINDLEQLKKNQSLTQKEKDTLQGKIEELNQQIMTKEQLQEQEKRKLQTEYQTQLQQEKTEKESWRDRYTQSTIERTILDSASRAGAFREEQIVDLLKLHTRLVELVDAEGKPTGEYAPRVKFKDTDAEGKPTVLDLSVEEAVKRMKDLPELFGNLFKANVSSGLGGTGSVGTGKGFDPRKIKTIEEYRKNRERIMKK